MNKHIRLLFMLSSIIIFNTKAEVETFINKLETPTEYTTDASVTLIS